MQPTELTRDMDPTFDGVICFGGVDWWYHNRGHYDIQMMRELSRRVPVLYVNSIGMKTPSVREGRMFLTRVTRKLRSLRQGLAQPRPRFFVYSPAALPGGATSSAAARHALAFQVRRAARRCGIRRPLVWVACPPAAAVLDQLNYEYVIYQRTDRFENYQGVDHARIAAFDRDMKNKADLVLFCARELYDAERDACRKAAFVDHGVDYEHFAQAGDAFERLRAAPGDLRGISRPRVGFVGGIDRHTFDDVLFRAVAAQLPACQFVMVGACSLPDGWCDLANVHLIGQRPYEAVAAYMAACDVLIMPWNQNEWIKACNPVKLKEYLAVGRPIVSTPFPELDHYREHVDVAAEPDAFARWIRYRIDHPVSADHQRGRVRAHGWATKSEHVWSIVTSRSPAPWAAMTSPN
jgi:glycosyltransferase involved in cell wall biosynthesis